MIHLQNKIKNLIAATLLIMAGLSACGLDPFKPDEPSDEKEKNGGEAATDTLEVMRLKYDACAKRGYSWLPGPKLTEEGECGEPLVTWCCKKATILQVFPSLSAVIDERLSSLAKQGYETYHCSQASTSAFMIHLLKVEDNKIDYTSVGVDNLEETEISETCQITAEDIFGKAGTASDPGNEYSEKIAPIIEKHCGGAACHVQSNSAIAAFVDNKSNVLARKDSIIDEVESGRMPKGATMPAKDKEALLEYLKAR